MGQLWLSQFNPPSRSLVMSSSVVPSNDSKRKREDIGVSSVWRIRTKDGGTRCIDEYYSDRTCAEEALCLWILEDLELNDWSHDDVKNVSAYFEFSARDGSYMKVIEEYKKDAKVMKQIAANLLPAEEYHINQITINGVKPQRESEETGDNDVKTDALKYAVVMTKGDACWVNVFSDKSKAEDEACEHMFECIRELWWFKEDMKALSCHFERIPCQTGSDPPMRLMEAHKRDFSLLCRLMKMHNCIESRVYITLLEPPSESPKKRKLSNDFNIPNGFETRLNKLENEATQLKVEMAELRTIKDKHVPCCSDVRCVVECTPDRCHCLS